MKDLYKTLGVSETADEASIKKAYRKLAKDLHPDVTGDDKKKTERFKEINEAYAVIGDEQKRKEYDRLKHAPVRPDGMPEGFDAEAFARTFGGRARTTAGGVEVGGAVKNSKNETTETVGHWNGTTWAVSVLPAVTSSRKHAVTGSPPTATAACGPSPTA